jgi:2-oxoglutarate dehydrogenase E1 component
VSVHQSTFLSGANAPFIAELYERFLENPSSIEPSWVQFFRGLQDDGAAVARELRGASWAPRAGGIIAHVNGVAAATSAAAAAGHIRPPIAAGEDAGRKAIQASIRALMLIRAYRVRGHLIAALDPLGIEERPVHADLDPASYGFDDEDFDQPIYIDRVLGRETATLREIVQLLQDTYCQSIGVEFMHISDPEQRIWIQERIEGERNHTDFTPEGKRAILERLTAAETFERFADRRYTGTKRFGLEGGESLIPALEQIVKRGGQLGVRELVLGMPHRGRLNVLANFMGKPFTAIFSEFQGNSAKPDDVQGSGDVKYHLGTSADRDLRRQRRPPLAVGQPLAPRGGEPGRRSARCAPSSASAATSSANQVVGLLMHGDAAFAGQGVVAETLLLSELRGYRTGGTINVVVNNQIGFTTAPAYARSGPYCTDVAKMVQAPIFHVNGDDPEAVVHVARVATEFRQRSSGRRHRHGLLSPARPQRGRRAGLHPAGDVPADRQPADHAQIYAARLAREGVLQDGEADGDGRPLHDHARHRFTRPPRATSRTRPTGWRAPGRARAATADDRRGETGGRRRPAAADRAALTTVPDGFDLNRKIARQLEAKRRCSRPARASTGRPASARLRHAAAPRARRCACPARMCGRGTFSQRHAVLVDQTTRKRYVPLAIRPGQARSRCRQPAVRGGRARLRVRLFAGRSRTAGAVGGAVRRLRQRRAGHHRPVHLLGRSKWLRMSGLVMLLPHGYEGQGPEHSSARLERFLQLCAEDNMQVVQLTTPANYFHALRRQMHRDFRKPLIVMTPKSLLRHKLAVSQAGRVRRRQPFHRVLWDDATPASKKLVAEAKRRVVLCSGKVYYDLLEAREAKGIDDVYLMRLEQLYPFPGEKLALELARFPKAEIVWCQEEPRNMGAWHFVDRRIEGVLTGLGGKAKRPTYVGRADSASTGDGPAAPAQCGAGRARRPRPSPSDERTARNKGRP